MHTRQSSMFNPHDAAAFCMIKLAVAVVLHAADAGGQLSIACCWHMPYLKQDKQHQAIWHFTISGPLVAYPLNQDMWFGKATNFSDIISL